MWLQVSRTTGKVLKWDADDYLETEMWKLNSICAEIRAIVYNLVERRWAVTGRGLSSCRDQAICIAPNGTVVSTGGWYETSLQERLPVHDGIPREQT